MTRDEMARIAGAAAHAVQLPPGSRCVVVVTDVEGDFVGVGSTATEGDTEAMLWCALNGDDRREHCTGIAAVWCPVHGDCSCPRRGGERTIEDYTCPLHGRSSTHSANAEDR